MSEVLFWGIGILLFIVLFHPILRSVQQIPAFRGGNAKVIAVCITLLGIIGIYQPLCATPGGHVPDTDKRGILFILIPYAAMVLAILITLLVRFWRKWFPAKHNLRNRKNAGTDGNDAYIPKLRSKKNKFIQKISK